MINILGPNLADLNAQYQKVVKPFIETPFLPQEVDSLAEKKDIKKYTMTNAILVAPQEKSTGLNEVNNYFLIFFLIKNNFGHINKKFFSSRNLSCTVLL